MTKLKIFASLSFISATVICISGWWGPFSVSHSMPSNLSLGSSSWVATEVNTLHTEANTLDMNVLKLSLTAYAKAVKEGLVNKQILTIIDYSKPSTERRLWVIDLHRGTVLYNTWVAHGKNSGNVYATAFSNQPGSLKSSFGVFRTENTYMGDNGYSLRISGLEHGINDNAERRDIVFHGAWYVGPDIVSQNGTLGRSWGCPAVEKNLAKPIIDTIKDNTLVFAYYPDKNWLNHSTFL